MEKKLSIVFGLLIGGMWLGEILLGNLGDTRWVRWPSPGSVGWSRHIEPVAFERPPVGVLIAR
jgi:hypothetical protein